MKNKSEIREGPVVIRDRTGILRALVLAAACAAFVACTVETDVGDELEELQKGQKAILERIEKMEKAQQELLAAWQQRSPQRPPIDFDKVYDIPTGRSPVRGAKDGKVILVEFSDFQCPYSQRTQPLIEALLKAYPADLRHVYKNFPLQFHKKAAPAAKACLAASMQGKFWEMHELVFKNPQKLEDEDLKGYAGKIGLDVQRFEEDCGSEAVQKWLEEDLVQAKKAGVTGTPTLFLNGKRVRNRSEEAMKEEIRSILEAKNKS